ncbi:two-component sensor histidine kinase [Dactylosporangium aurantiacum]|uniref:histidine kinase n=1 Tax=Dactylosporangium aurantiacum TaxID=35754 RepID=A0A9Q9IKR2_9ACTN|nr:histidine kinase [Dactylosporangium aurantiacum]MDG6106093.1 histidine kinase [Dactylosporangium aurantiacum]UWZ55865.1 two-component sensor histidine kinase [Dactylosporangium aurantiacum]
MRTRRRAVVTGYTLLALVGLTAVVSLLDHGAAGRGVGVGFWLQSVLAGLAFAFVGALLVALRPGNLLGPVLLTGGGALVLEFSAREYAFRGLVLFPGSLPGAAAAGWCGLLLDPVFFPLTIALTLLLFPDGRLPSRRWRPVVAVGLLATAAQVVLHAVADGPLRDETYHYDIPWRGPVGAGWSAAAQERLTQAGLLILLASVVRLLLRYRTLRAEDRQPVKPLALVGSAAVVSLALQFAPPLAQTGRALLVAVVCAGLPAALAVGALRHRVWEFDRVLVGTFVYTALTVLITATYVGVVVAAGHLAGRGGDRPALLPSVLATALVAVGVSPVKSALERAARRLVYGVRATPYQALAALPRQLAEAPVVDEVLPRTARALADGLGVTAARVRAFVPGAAPLVSWSSPPAGPGDEDGLLVVAVRHLGEEVGDVAVRPPVDRSLSGADRRLLADLAAQAGPALRGVALAAELRARLEQLTESRTRLATAQVEERRRLERDIHDGAQQQLVALAVHLQQAEELAGTEAARAAVAACREELGRCIDELRELARGIYPPVLAARGLTAALRGRARSGAGNLRVAVRSTVDGRRFSPAVELAAYFTALEALQNAAKHAPGSTVTVSLDERDGRLALCVADDGPGFTAPAGGGTGLLGMADRIGAAGGAFAVDSTPRGTTVTALLPY